MLKYWSALAPTPAQLQLGAKEAINSMEIAFLSPTINLQLWDNLGSWFSVYNLILTQLDEICKKKLGCHQKKNKKKYHFQTT